MSINELSLEVSEAPSVKVLRLIDTSHYCDDELDNYIIEILPVNKSTWLTFHVQKNFSLALNSSSLGYRRVAEASELRDLPDGIYEINQSYKPNIHSMQKYFHLRVQSTRRKIRKEWDKLVDDTCSLTREEFFANREKLREIDEYLAAAKFKVEDCHNKEEGKELYEWTIKLQKNILMSANVKCDFANLKYEQFLTEKYFIETCFSKKSESYPPKQRLKDMWMDIKLDKCK